MFSVPFVSADRWATSIVNPGARHTYLRDKGGLLIAPTVRLFCACNEDCNSQAKSDVDFCPVESWCM